MSEYYKGNIKYVDVSHLTSKEVRKRFKSSRTEAKTIYKPEGDTVRLYGLQGVPNSLFAYDWPPTANWLLRQRYCGVVLDLDKDGKDTLTPHRFILQFHDYTSHNHPISKINLYCLPEAEHQNAHDKMDEEFNAWFGGTYDEPADYTYQILTTYKRVYLDKWDEIKVAHLQAQFDSNATQGYEAPELARLINRLNIFQSEFSEEEILYGVEYEEPIPTNQEVIVEDTKLNKFGTILGIIATFLTITQFFKNN